MSIHHPDHADYFPFSKRQRIDKAVHTLIGILGGVSIDGSLNAAEISEILNWSDDHRDLITRQPFQEIFEKLDSVMADGLIDPEEQEDLLWLCQNLSVNSVYFESITNEIQILHGILHGILADGIISEDEAKSLSEWVGENEHLKGTYPFDELDSLLTSSLADGKLDEQEQATLRDFFEDFIQYSVEKSVTGVSERAKGFTLPGVCAVCPEITFKGKTFTLTGSSYKGSRKEIVEKLEAFEATFNPNVTGATDYLVIGAAGNPCWAFSCYGRKVEKAVSMRKEGHSIKIVHESDFWDSVADL
jgi:NAD-dependent DNA ligase